MPDLPPTEELASVFARMSGLLLTQETVRSAVEVVCALAAETVPRTVGAGVSLLDERGQRTTAGATDPVVARADTLQYELDQGPCLSAWRERAPYRIDDMTTDTRWPDWSPRAADLGLRSALSVPLVAGAQALGALKVYAAEPVAYDGRSERLLTMFAAQAAVLLSNVQSAENARRLSDALKHALDTRDAVAMAKGLIMAREGVDEPGAFAVLVRLARQDGRTVAEAARHLLRPRTRGRD